MKIASDYRVPPTSGWTIRHVNGLWTLCPMFDSGGLDAYQRSSLQIGNVPLPPEAEADAAILLAEIRSHVPKPRPYSTELGTVRAELHEHVSHVLAAPDCDAIRWNYEWLRDGTAVESIVPIPVPTNALSEAAQRAIDVFRGLSTEIVARSYIALVHKLTDGASPVPEFPKWKVFVSYRKSDLAAAIKLREAFRAFGNGAHFSCYIDQRNVQLGDWLAQFAGEIDRCDLFAAVVSSEYAPAGSISRKELDLALQKSKHIAPVVLGTDRPSAWEALKGFHAAFFLTEGELHLANPELSGFLRVCLSTLHRGG